MALSDYLKKLHLKQKKRGKKKKKKIKTPFKPSVRHAFD